VVNAVFGRTFRWTIKARITSKSDIRRWSNAKGEGTLFSIDLLDSDGGEIRATFFKEACDKWFPVLEEGKVCNNSCRLACIPSDFN
jgi:replication factor A1